MWAEKQLSLTAVPLNYHIVRPTRSTRTHYRVVYVWHPKALPKRRRAIFTRRDASRRLYWGVDVCLWAGVLVEKLNDRFGCETGSFQRYTREEESFSVMVIPMLWSINRTSMIGPVRGPENGDCIHVQTLLPPLLLQKILQSIGWQVDGMERMSVFIVHFSFNRTSRSILYLFDLCRTSYGDSCR